MSEFGPSFDPDQEAQGVALAQEIANLQKTASTDEDYEAILRKANAIKELFGVESEGKLLGEVLEQIAEAKEIFGSDCMGPDEIKEAFGFVIEPSEVPKIPFGRAELEKAKEMGQMLVLRSPMTLNEINGNLNGKVKDSNKLLYGFDETTGRFKDDCWYKDEAFLDERIETKWALVSKAEIPDSTSKNYLDQMEKMIDYLKESFSGEEMPEVYDEAIKEYAMKKGEIARIISSDWQKAAEELEGLKLNQLLRQTPAEAVYDLALYFQTTGTRLMENMYTWTKRRPSDGGLVSVGRFRSGGVGVDGSRPDDAGGYLGVSFSRSL